MKKTVGTILACIACWAAVLGICFGLLCAAAAVPQKSIRDNLDKSCNKLAAQGPHDPSAGSLYNSVRDNYADAVLLGVAANMGLGNAVKSALDTKYFDDGYGPAVGIKATLNGMDANNDYTRYWHGSLVVVRPLLALADIDGVRFICAVIIVILLVGNAAWLIYKKHTAACVIFLISAVLVQFWFVFTTLEYMAVFMIMLAALPLFVHFADRPRALVITAAGVGTLTAFADFLTAETLTILVPLTSAFFINAEKGEKPDGKKSLLTALSCMAAWGGAYLLSFVTKWAAASAVLGKDVSGAAMSAAAERMSGTGDEITSPVELLFSALGANFSMLTPTSDKISIIGMIVWIVLFALALVILYRRDTKRLSLPAAAMIVIAAVPVLRFCVLMNHAYLHNFFTYRALMPSIMALIGLMWYRVSGAKKNVRKIKK